MLSFPVVSISRRPVLVADSLAINDVDIGGQLSQHAVDLESLWTTVNVSKNMIILVVV